MDRTTPEEVLRSVGERLTYRVDELPPGEYKLMTSERSKNFTLDIWKLKQEAAIVVATKTCGKEKTIVPSELLHIHRRKRWLIPERMPVAWGSWEKRIGFVNSTFWDVTKYPNMKISDLDPFRLENNPTINYEILFYKMHRYDSDFLSSVYNVGQ